MRGGSALLNCDTSTKLRVAGPAAHYGEVSDSLAPNNALARHVTVLVMSRPGRDPHADQSLRPAGRPDPGLYDTLLAVAAVAFPAESDRFLRSGQGAQGDGTCGDGTCGRHA